MIEVFFCLFDNPFVPVCHICDICCCVKWSFSQNLIYDTVSTVNMRKKGTDKITDSVQKVFFISSSINISNLKFFVYE